MQAQFDHFQVDDPVATFLYEYMVVHTSTHYIPGTAHMDHFAQQESRIYNWDKPSVRIRNVDWSTSLFVRRIGNILVHRFRSEVPDACTLGG